MHNNKLSLVLFVLIIGCYYQLKTEAYRLFDVDGVITILALENEYINIECRTDVPITYCGFVHQSGKRYSFSGPTLDAGHCSIKVKATNEETGEWRCHLGKKTTRIEATKFINVRIVNEVAAVRQNITAVHGKPVTLYCCSTRALNPLSYCRFEPPNGIPFSIDSDVTHTNPILNRYYFPRNKSLNRGDCGVTITKVQYEDVGKWTCSAGLDEKEYIDSITLAVAGFYTMSKASVTGITFGVIGIFAFISALGFIAWKKRSLLGGRHRETPEPAEVHELEHLEESPQTLPTRVIPKIIIQSPSNATPMSTPTST